MSWDVPAIFGRGSRLLDESIMTCREIYCRTANLEDVLAIAEEPLSVLGKIGRF